MPIDVDTPRSPGWQLKRLFEMLTNRSRQYRLQLLHDYHSGHSPLPDGAENAREAFEQFQKKSRSNFAELIVSAVGERMTVDGFRTALDQDETGDAEVGNMWQRAGMDVESATVHDLMLSMSEAYVIVGAMDEDMGAPVVTAEDPRFMVAETDPMNPRKLIAALKVLHDEAAGEDRAYLYLPGQILVARNERTPMYLPPELPNRAPAYFDPRSWSWDENRSGRLQHNRIPVVRFVNKHNVGEYEPHTDLLDRINHQILQRMVIATLQAFRQRAIKNLPYVDETGKEIDYRGVFTMDPAALWQLPEGTEMWESAQTDLRPILEAVKDDVTHLAAVTRTPMTMMMPAGDNQSAEGAALQREGLVFKARDRISRTSFPWAQVASLMLTHAGQPDRADLAKLSTIWARPEHLSMSERADASSKAINDMPKRTRLIKIWGFTPVEADRVMSEWADEQLLATQLQAGGAGGTGAPAAAVPATPEQAAAPVPADVAPVTAGAPLSPGPVGAEVT